MADKQAPSPSSPFQLTNIRCFILLRLFFNARFYYPVFTVLFVDYGLSIEQFAILNSIWALTIVVAEVPSGALADLLGRRSLLLLTAGSMVLEMALLAFVPLGNGKLLFAAFLINRILSGLAEAMASGADEALAYDSLKAHGLEESWGHVLDVQMRVRSAGHVVAMTVGAFVFDSAAVNRLLQLLGSELTLSQQLTMRLPVILTLLLALAALASVLRMEENQARPAATASFPATLARASRLTWQAGRWIATTPQVLLVILFAMFFDHILRMLATLVSQYYRLIGLPEASFGLIGSAIALVGILVPRLARLMSERLPPGQNMLILTLVSFSALMALLLEQQFLGIVAMALVFLTMTANSFFCSHYLNHATDSHWRATVLSFKGLFFNLAYGAMGFFYASLYNRGQQGQSTNDSFSASLPLFPSYFLVGFGLLFLFALWKRRTLQPQWWLPATQQNGQQP